MTAFYSSFYPPEADMGAKGSAAFTSAALSGYLTNENHTVAADFNGGSYSLTGAGGTFKVFNGTTDVTTTSTTFSVVAPATKNGLTMSIDSVGVYTLSGASWTTDSETFTLRAVHDGVTIELVYSLSKSKAGTNGAAAKVLTISSDRQTIVYNAAGTSTPTTQTTTFTANKQNTTSTVNWGITDSSGVARTPVTSFLSAATGDSVTMTEAQFASARNGTSGVIVTGTLTDGSTLIDRVSVVRIQEGQPGTDGTNGLNNAIVYLYQRSATTPTAPTGTFTYTFATSTLSGGTPGSWTQTIPANNGNPLWVIAATASSSTATDTIAAAEFSSPVVLSQDGATGPNGLNTATVFLYQRATSAPAVPSTTTTYTFATGVLTGTLGSWTQTIPAGTDPLYVTTATAAATTATDTILTSEWAAVRVLAQNGVNGTNGSNNVVVLIYQRANSAPAAPSVTATYTFSTANLTGLNNGWSSTIPANNGQPLWVRTAVASSTIDTDTIASNEWSGANILTGSGLNTAAVFIYQRAASAPAAPSVDATYTFSTGSITGLNNGWTSSVPTANGQPLWVRQASASSAETTDIIASGEWSAASIISQDGANGQPGTPAVSGFLTNESTSLFAYANGVVTSYGPATGQFRVFSGTTDISSSFSLSTVSNPQALTVTYTNQTYTVSGGFDANEDTATLTIRATGSGSWTGITIDKIFSLSKTKGGYEIVASLPPAGDPRRFEGSTVFLTTDDKLYRFDGTNWTSAVPSTDISGQILNAQIADNAITGPKILDSSIETSKIDNLAITGVKLANSSVEASKIANGAVSSSKLGIGVGGNMLTGAVPGTNPNRWADIGFNPDNITYSGGSLGILRQVSYTSGEFGSEWTLPDNSTFALYQANNNTGATGLSDIHLLYTKDQSGTLDRFWPIEQGKTYEFSAYTGAHRCNVQVLISWFNATSFISSSDSALNASNEKTGGITLDGYKRLVARGTPPAGATRAILAIRKYHTASGFADSWVFINRPMFAETTANATEALPYSVPAAGIINADQLVTNSITTSRIAAGAITTNKLLVVPAGFCPDPLFNDMDYWSDIEVNERSPVLITLYARATTLPARPTPTYNFLTGQLTNLGTTWTQTIPTTGTGSLWVITATAYLNQQLLSTPESNNYTFTTSDWASAASGSTTVDTTNKISFRLYLRNNTTAPAMPTGGSYNFSTGVWTLPSGWSLTPPVWQSTSQNLWVVYGTVLSASTTGTPVYGLTTPRRGEAGSWYFETSGSTLTAIAMGVPKIASMWVGNSGPITHTLALYSDLLPFSGRGQALRLRANCANFTNQSLTVGVQFFNSSNALVYSDLALSAAPNSGYTVPSVIQTLPSNLQIASYRFVIFNGGGSALNGGISVSDIKLDTAAGAELIVDGAITATKVATNAITSDKIEANAITAGKIQAGAVTANKLLVVPNNLNPDPLFRDESNWILNEANAWYFEDSTTSSVAIALGYRKYAALWSGAPGANIGTGRRHIYSQAIPFNGRNQILRLRGRGWNGSNQDLWLGLEFLDSSGNYISGSYTPGLAAGVGAGDITRQVTVPNNTGFIRVMASNAAPGSTFSGSLAITDIKVDIAASAEMVVDGAITADKIATNAITSDKIEANAITAGKIQAGAVTAAKIAVTELSAIAANVGTLTAGVIRNAADTFRVELDNGRTVVITGSAMKVTGAPFGVGNQFIEWYGPYNTGLTLAQNIAACNTNNARYYLTVSGGAYFGGSLAAGILRTSVGTPSLLSNASVESGAFGSNGGTITVVFSYSAYAESTRFIYPATSTGVNDWNAAIAAWGTTADALGFANDSKAITPGTTTILLDRSVNNGAYTDGVSTLTLGNGIETIFGDRPVIGDSDGYLDYTRSFSGSVTYTDPQTNTSIRAYRARLTARGTNIFGGSFTVNQSQLISINTQE